MKHTKGELVKFINIAMCTMREIAFVSFLLIIICSHLVVVTHPSTENPNDNPEVSNYFIASEVKYQLFYTLSIGVNQVSYQGG